MGIILRYPQPRPKKKIEVDPDAAVFTVAQVCVLLGLSRWTVIRIFEHEPGILVRVHPEKMHKRGRRIIRIPRAAFLRVRAKMEKAGKT
jgi:hypothetical protein